MVCKSVILGIALICLSVARPQKHAIDWGAKKIDAAVARKTAGFRLLELGGANFTQKDMEIVWVQAHTGMRTPGRKAVHIEYITEAGPLHLVEAKEVQGLPSMLAVSWILGQGYFKFPEHFSIESPNLMVYGAAKGTAICVVGSEKAVNWALIELRIETHSNGK